MNETDKSNLSAPSGQAPCGDTGRTAAAPPEHPSRRREDLELWDRCYDRQKDGMPFLDCVSLFADAIRAQAKTALDYFAEDVEASICDTCHGKGQVCVGNSGRDDDGNAPVMERCPECGYRADTAAAPQMPADRIAMLWNSLPLETDPQSVMAFVRAVEDFHGIAGMAKDAARYQFLRSNEAIVNDGLWASLGDAEDEAFDSAVDRAMREVKP